MRRRHRDGLPDFRRMPVPDAIRWLAEHGEPADPRPDVDTASLVRRFPHLAGVTTVGRRRRGPARPVPVRVYRDAAGDADRSRARVGARRRVHRRQPRHARVELGRARARRTRHPGRRGGLREVPGRRALSRCRRTTCSRRGGTCAMQPWSCSGCRRSRSPSAARARAERSRPARSPGCATRGSRCRQDSCSSTRSCTPTGLRRPTSSTRRRRTGSSSLNFAGSDRGTHGSAGVRRPRRRPRIPADAHRGVRARRTAPLGRGLRRDAPRCRGRGRAPPRARRAARPHRRARRRGRAADDRGHRRVARGAASVTDD